MMESKELAIVHKLTKQMRGLVKDINEITDSISELSNLLFDKEIERCNNEIDEYNKLIKLHSHM